MIRYGGSRLVRAIVVVLLATFLVSLLVDLLPGDSALTLAGEDATDEQLAETRKAYGLDRPVVERYASWLGDAVGGDLGESVITSIPVTEELRRRFGLSLELALGGVTVGVVLGIVLAVASVRWRGTFVDGGTSVLTSAVISLPGFLLGVLLIYVFAVRARWLPVTGWVPWGESASDHVRSMLLPVLTLALPEAVVIQRVLRVELVSTLSKDFALAARARGVGPTRVIVRHGLRLSSFSLLTLVGLTLGRLIGGTVLVEAVFSLPGMGRYLLQAIQQRDLQVVQSVVACVAVVYVAVNLVVDVLYGVLDPRVRRRAS